MAGPIKADFISNRSHPRHRSTAQQFFTVRSHESVWRTLRTSIARGEGIVAVTGEMGIGKSQLLLRLQSILPENRDIALISDAGQPLASFTQVLCKATGSPRIAGPDEWSITPKELLNAIANLVKSGRKFLVAIDQAHRLSGENLAILNKLVLFSINQTRPVQILLVGRPELSECLDLPAFRTLKSAVIASVEMTPLTRVEVWEYIRFQTQRIVGETIRMTWPAWLEIVAASRGNPYEINVVLQKILLLVQERGARILTGDLVRKARMDLDPNYHPPPGKGLMPWLSIAVVVLALSYGFGTFFSFSSSLWQTRVLEEDVGQKNVLTSNQNEENSRAGKGPDPEPKTNKKQPALSQPKHAAQQEPSSMMDVPQENEEPLIVPDDEEVKQQISVLPPQETPPGSDMPTILPIRKTGMTKPDKNIDLKPVTRHVVQTDKPVTLTTAPMPRPVKRPQ